MSSDKYLSFNIFFFVLIFLTQNSSGLKCHHFLWNHPVKASFNYISDVIGDNKYCANSVVPFEYGNYVEEGVVSTCNGPRHSCSFFYPPPGTNCCCQSNLCNEFTRISKDAMNLSIKLLNVNILKPSNANIPRQLGSNIRRPSNANIPRMSGSNIRRPLNANIPRLSGSNIRRPSISEVSRLSSLQCHEFVWNHETKLNYNYKSIRQGSQWFCFITSNSYSNNAFISVQGGFSKTCNNVSSSCELEHPPFSNHYCCCKSNFCNKFHYIFNRAKSNI